jgi:rhamnogalacturonyl hydrolase YesR
MTPGYDLARNITMHWDSAVGDHIGLFPIAYLQRGLYRNESIAGSSTDMRIARLTANHYILQWPHRLEDGTFSRTVTGDWPGEHSSKVGSIVWGDDQTMGTVLVARMAPLLQNTDYAAEVTRQQIGFADRLRDPADGLNYHGYNDADGHESCCKWGRANGWGMLGHAEAIASMAAWPAGYPNATANARVKEIFVQHAAAAKATQAPDGRWHQLLNDTDSFLETSVTAMFLTSIVRGVRDGILPKKDYASVIEKAWDGLVSTILKNGTVTGVCCGTGIQRDAHAYYIRPTFYGCSGPGGAGAVLYAAVDLAKGY